MKIDHRKLSYLTTKVSTTSSVSTAEPEFFIIVKNHRQSRIRKYLRKLRKQAQEQRKIEEAQSFQAFKSELNCILNCNMLKEEYLWEILIDYEKGEVNSETQQSRYKVKSKEEIRKEFVRRLPVGDKGSLWDINFTEFKYLG